MSTGPKVERRGGYRPNAGRKPTKPTSLSAYQVARMLRKARKFAKLYKKDLDDLLLEFAHDPNGRVADRLGAIKLFKDLTMPRISEGGEADKALGPAVFLPEQRPVLTSVEGGKAA
jgi:hypothetical protein